MVETILNGHRVCGGKVEGKALVSTAPITFLGGIDPETGKVIEKGHELEGETITDRILVFPVAKGSTGGAYHIYELACFKRAPKAIINLRADPVLAVGSIMGKIPTVDRLDKNPLELIKTGDVVYVDAEKGMVKVISV
jgi:predicted aconitase with swiveling domain